MNIVEDGSSRLRRWRERTEAFRRWFGGSQVVDASGAPLVVYHGTVFNVTQFDLRHCGRATSAAWAALGFFFTPDPRLASDFTKGKNWGKASALPRRGGNVMPVYLSLQNPLCVPASRMLPLSGSPTGIAQLRAEASGGNFDGIIIEPFHRSFGFEDTTGELHVPQYVAFWPEQIKSALGNSGRFDPASADLCDRAEAPRP